MKLVDVVETLDLSGGPKRPFGAGEVIALYDQDTGWFGDRRTDLAWQVRGFPCRRICAMHGLIVEAGEAGVSRICLLRREGLVVSWPHVARTGSCKRLGDEMMRQRSMVRIGVLALAGHVAGGCAWRDEMKGASVADTPDAGGAVQAARLEEADFQTLSVEMDGGLCPNEQGCGASILLRRDGTLEHVFRGRRFEGRVTDAELDLLVSLVSSASTIQELRKIPGCPGAIHATEQTVIEIVPGIFVEGDISGCHKGPLAALRHSLHAVTKRLFPESQISSVPATAPPDLGTRFRLSEPWSFGGFSLHRQWGPCAPAEICAENLSVMPAEGVVSQLGGSPRGQWRGVTDFGPLSAVAVSAPVIAELRKPAPCPSTADVPTDVSETMFVTIGARMYLRRSTAGCNAGPIADLRFAARALVVRLSGDVDRDAAAEDHPDDLLSP